MEAEPQRFWSTLSSPPSSSQFQSFSNSCFSFLSLLFLLRACLMTVMCLMEKVWLLSRLSHHEGQPLKHLHSQVQNMFVCLCWARDYSTILQKSNVYPTVHCKQQFFLKAATRLPKHSWLSRGSYKSWIKLEDERNIQFWTVLSREFSVPVLIWSWILEQEGEEWKDEAGVLTGPALGSCNRFLHIQLLETDSCCFSSCWAES